MISKVPADLEILCIYEIFTHRPFLRVAGDITEGARNRREAWTMPRQDLLLHSGSVFVKTVTFFFFGLIYMTVGKQPPEQAVPPLGTININMCAGPSAPASLCVNEA